MKKLLLLFVFISALSKAQNDSITFFAYTDYNNNCLYEPGMGEEPLKHFPFQFEYIFTTGFGQFNTKTTNDTGYVTFHAVGALAPASNTISIANCGFISGGVYLSTCGQQNLAYNATYSLGVSSLSGPQAFNVYQMNSLGIGSFFCAAPYAFFNLNLGVSYNYTGNNMIVSPVTLSFAGGSTDTQMYVGTSTYNSTGCGSNVGGIGNPFTNPEFGIPGIYTITVVAPGVNAATYTQSFVVIVDSCQLITGNVYVDCNANCNKDANEYNCDEEAINATNGTYSTTVIPDYNGNYYVQYPYSSSQYTVSIIPNPDFALTCATPPVTTFYANTANASFSNNTLIQTAVNNTNYFSTQEHPYGGSTVPGGNFKFASYYDVTKPDFCSAVNNSGVYYIKLDQNTQLSSVDPGTPNYTNIYTTASGDSIVWSFTDLRLNAMNLGGHRFILNITMKPTATIGLPFNITSGISSNVTETTLADNRMTGSWMIGGPFDPNYIEVTPKGTGTQGYIPANTTELYYSIHFQNVGTAPAIDVKIKNLLDAGVDKNTLKIIGSSAPVQTNIDGNGLATFLFDNVMLADSTHDEPNSHGFVNYKINLKPGLAAGTQIHNTAAIYFDYNAAVLTNTVLNTLQTVTGIKEIKASSFSVYPNPSNGVVNINSSETIIKVSVINVLGETVRVITADSKSVTIDISDLKSNVYFVQITDGKNQTSVKKIVKE